MPFVRVREHVNPLSRKFQVITPAPNWSAVFSQVDRPLHLDIGCGRGRFLLEMAQLQPNWNFLGLEIRQPLVDQANDWCQEQGLTNLYYLFCNANTSLRSLLASLPPASLYRVTIQFPDPWFKRRHQKRRVVQPEMVTDLAAAMVEGGAVLVQSDVLDVAREMCDRFDANALFQRVQIDWLADNPLPIATERELSTLKQGQPVYRMVFTKVCLDPAILNDA